jgi:hypothetical protein
MVTSRRRVTKYLVRGSLCSIAVIVGAQIYAVRELLAILLMLCLSFFVFWISLSIFVALCEISWRAVNWLATHGTRLVIRLRHPMVPVSAGEGPKN